MYRIRDQTLFDAKDHKEDQTIHLIPLWTGNNVTCKSAISRSEMGFFVSEVHYFRIRIIITFHLTVGKTFKLLSLWVPAMHHPSITPYTLSPSYFYGNRWN